MKNLIKNYVAGNSSKTVHEFGQYDSKYKLDDTRKTLMNIKEQARNKPYRINDILSPIREEYDSDYDHYKNMPLTAKVHDTGQIYIIFPSYLAIDKIYFEYSDGTNETKQYDYARINDIYSKTLYNGQWVSISIVWNNNASAPWCKSLIFTIENDDYTVTCPSYIDCTCEFEVYGNIKSLYSNRTYNSFGHFFSNKSLDTFTALEGVKQGAEFPNLSYDIYEIDTLEDSNLVDAFNLVLPEPNLAGSAYGYYQYESLFENCRKLKRGPKIIKHTLKQGYQYIYRCMFKNCSALVYAPIFLIKVYNGRFIDLQYSLWETFRYCSKLEKVCIYTYPYTGSATANLVQSNTFKDSSNIVVYSNKFSNKWSEDAIVYYLRAMSSPFTIKKEFAYVLPVIYIDDIGDAEGNIDEEPYEDWVAGVNETIVEHSSSASDPYVYLGHCWYKGEMYHGWESLYNDDVAFVLTSLCDFDGLSLTDNINNRCTPVVHSFTRDEEISSPEEYGAVDNPDENPFILWRWNHVLPFNTMSGKPKIWISDTLTGIDLNDYENTCECYEYWSEDAQQLIYRKVNDKTNEYYDKYIEFDKDKHKTYCSGTYLYDELFLRTYIDDNYGKEMRFDSIYDGNGNILYKGNYFSNQTYHFYLIATNKLFRRNAVIDFGD